MNTAPLVLVNVVGLTKRWLPSASRLQTLAHKGGWCRLKEVYPSVTCTAQANLLTGFSPQEHGIVANGWLYRDTMEVRFWQQSNRLLQREPVYATARRLAQGQGKPFSCAKLFWWFNQGADVQYSLTPKPHYGLDGNKIFDVMSQPSALAEDLKEELGAFPFHAFWGPMSGLLATQWIAQAAARVVERFEPHLTLVYLPHLDYDPQRLGPHGCDMVKLLSELETCLAEIERAVQRVGARLWIVSEYGHRDVSQPVYLNRKLREQGWLQIRNGPFGEQLDCFASKAMAVCDHQLAHIYVQHPEDIPAVRAQLEELPGVDRVLAGAERQAVQLDHPRSGELVVLAKENSWLAYPFWLDDRLAPDYARCVAIHHKPGFDPCELFFDPKLWFPKGRAFVRLLQKQLGFRARFDVIPLDGSLVRGSHGLPASDPLDQPLLIVDDAALLRQPHDSALPMTAVRNLILHALGFAYSDKVK